MENRAFEEMLKPAINRVQKKAPEEMAEKAGVFFDKEASRYILATLGQEITIAFPSCEFSERLEDWHTLLTLHYLELADGTPLSGQWIPFGNLKDGLIRGTKFDRTAEKALQAAFHGKSLEQIKEICQGLGGEFQETKADLGVKFLLFPRYPMLLNLWMEDDEFPLTGKLFVDQQADHYLTIEDAVTAGSIILDRLSDRRVFL